ncbi:concanavalin A-like lectin/glucanase [Lindgomyces ingoldianus]|uniref:Concanavalin A-like lectin/glucanase n=1 Tax=Lindgomyces ingoldianus TaxID=673940 RepID=A0ACB6R8V3_9PLEO|nr:concanavalin A-like lectin/glucanase [Lindgomyces ingoldianus]KAF2475586.1 concanavalin A-like lectin/glucanase [Lindgomyces ingoldianus]
MCRLAKNKSDNTPSQLNQSFEKLDNHVEDACKGVQDQSERAFDEVASGGKDGVNDREDGLEKVRERGDNGGHSGSRGGELLTQRVLTTFIASHPHSSTMSSSLNKLFEKGKAKVKEYSSSHSSHPSQGYPSQQQQQPPYPASPYPPQPYPQSPYNQQPPPNQHPNPYSPNPNPLYQHQNPQYGPPPGQWGPPPSQVPSSFSAPPIPQHSKPSARPVPTPTSTTENGDKNRIIYWQPTFSPSIPVTQNFTHELGAHGWGNNESQNYVSSPSNSFHTPDGRLVVRAISQNGQYTSARLTSHQTLSRARGYLSVSIVSAPCAEGIWPAFWLLPKDPFKWPEDGEVDIFESWNGDCVNHSCLHWGQYNGEDWNKHRVIETHIPSMASSRHTFGFAWMEEEGVPGWRGRLMWYIDGKPVMRGCIPLGARRMEEFRILVNVAMGGNVCQGKLPREGVYDFVIAGLAMCQEPDGGWDGFERAWREAPEGKTM